jgi:hypothetical protein
VWLLGLGCIANRRKFWLGKTDYFNRLEFLCHFLSFECSLCVSVVGSRINLKNKLLSVPVRCVVRVLGVCAGNNEQELILVE